MRVRVGRRGGEGRRQNEECRITWRRLQLPVRPACRGPGSNRRIRAAWQLCSLHSGALGRFQSEPSPGDRARSGVGYVHDAVPAFEISPGVAAPVPAGRRRNDRCRRLLDAMPAPHRTGRAPKPRNTAESASRSCRAATPRASLIENHQRGNPMRCFAGCRGDDGGNAAPGSPVWRPKGLPRLTPTRDLPACGKRLTWDGIGRDYGILALRYRSHALSPGY